MKQRRLAGLDLAWDAGNLPVDPFEIAMPLVLETADLDPGASREAIGPAPSDDPDRPAEQAADIVIHAGLTPHALPDPGRNGATRVLYHGPTYCFLLDGSLLVWDGASMLRIAPDGRSIAARVHASSLDDPFVFAAVAVTMALLLAFRYHGRFHLHAAAARLPGGDGWLMPGNSGSGKSTLSLALYDSGANWLSDDAVLLQPCGSEVEAAGWARRIHVTDRTAEAFPSLAPHLTPGPPSSKRQWQIDPRRAFSGRGLFSLRSPLTLIVPTVGSDRTSTVRPLARAEALGCILHACAWVACDHLVHRQQQLELLGRLVDRSRCYEISLGRRLLEEPRAELEQIAALIRAR